MRLFRRGTALILALLLTLSLSSFMTASASYVTANDMFDDANLIGSMEIVNCTSYASLREYPDTGSTLLMKIPLGAVVTDCYGWDDRFTWVTYGDMQGYVLNTNLAFIYGPRGYEFTDDEYLGNYRIVNCKSYASLRQYPDSSSLRLAQIPLGDVITNVFYYDDRFSWCMYGDMEGYILNDNLTWVSGGTATTTTDGYLGDCVIVNCLMYASLREYPDTRSARILKVPRGSIVTDCYIVDDRFAWCNYNGYTGYILLDNLGW